MEGLTEPLITEERKAAEPEIVVTTVNEDDVTRTKERVSSFIEIGDTHRTNSVKVDGIPRHMSLPLVDPRSSLTTTRTQSVVVSGDNCFILEESPASSREVDDSKEAVDGGLANDNSTRSFINVHVSFICWKAF